MYSLQDVLFSASLAVYVAVGVIVAVVRWGHKCKPFDKHMDYYYPAWKTLVSCAFANLVLLPTVFMPTEGDAILLLRLILIIGPPYMCAMLVFSYFGQMLKITWWRKPMYALAIAFFLMAGTAIVFTFIPGDQLSTPFGRGFFAIGGILSLVYVAIFGMSLRMLGKAIHRKAEANYSNPEDFPRQYAGRVLWLSNLFVLTSWICTTIGTQLVLSLAMLVLSVLAVIFLIGVLSPHRAMEVERLEKGETVQEAEEEEAPAQAVMESAEVPETESPSAEATLSPERQEEIVKAIRHFVEDDRAYLDSHLTLASLSRSIGFNRTYVSSVMSERLGGFFTYVNRCRLAHATQLKVEQPEIAVADLAIASGFGSRQTYYNVRRQLEV